MKITNLIKSLFLAAVVLSSCTQEPMVGPSVAFNTTLEAGGVAYAGEPFVVRVERNKAEFYAVYSGVSDAKKYGVPGATGDYLNQSTDSITITYPAAGEYMLTIVASSTGNQGVDFGREIDSLLVTVHDRRATFVVFNYYLTPALALVGSIADDNTITAGYVDYPGVNYLFKPEFITSSPGAKVYLNEVKDENLQTSGVNEHDFSNADQVPLKYIVVSPTGNKTEYLVTLEKKEAEKEAKIDFIQNMTAAIVHDTALPICINAARDEWVIDLVCNNSDPANRYLFNIVSSFGSTVQIYRTSDNQWTNFSSATRYYLNVVDSIRVISQSRTKTTTYKFNAYNKILSTFKFVKGNNDNFNPHVNGIVNLEENSVTFNLSKSTYSAALESLVAEWTTSASKVMLGTNEIQSGVTVFNFKPANAADTQVKRTLSFVLGNSTYDIDVIINLID